MRGTNYKANLQINGSPKETLKSPTYPAFARSLSFNFVQLNTLFSEVFKMKKEKKNDRIHLKN